MIERPDKHTEDDNILFGLAVLAGLVVPLSLLAITNLTSFDPFLMLVVFPLIGFGTPCAILTLALRLRYERARRRLLLWCLLGVNAFILVGTVSLVVIGGITGGTAAERKLQDNSYDGNDRAPAPNR